MWGCFDLGDIKRETVVNAIFDINNYRTSFLGLGRTDNVCKWLKYDLFMSDNTGKILDLVYRPVQCGRQPWGSN